MEKAKITKLQVADFAKRVFQYGVGLMIVALGISVSIKSNLGVSPVSSLPFVFSMATKIPFSVCSSAFYVCYIAIQWLILGKLFKPTLLFQMIPALAFGFFVELADICLAWLAPPEIYAVRLCYIVVSALLIAIGVRMYFGARLVNMPSEGIAKALIVRFGFPLHKAKLTFDVSSVSLAFALSIIALGGIFGVREGTVLISIGVGYFIKLINIMLEKIARSKNEK